MNTSTDVAAQTVIETARAGYELLNDPILNKGTAFTADERDAFRLHGLLPPWEGTLELQMERRMEVLRNFGTNLERYAFLRDLQDTNETLHYALLANHLEELMPMVYTPTVGLGCQQFSKVFRKPRGLFLSLPLKDRISEILANPVFDQVECIVVTDGERILGLGDQGAGGMGIPIGKLALYTGCGGLHPATTLPILLDVGTNNKERLEDPLYVGWAHERVGGQEYDDFIEAFVTAVDKRWPHVLLQWEDFAQDNAARLLTRYQDRLCTFNDDIQGTAAVTMGTILAAIEKSGQGLKDQRFVILGAGSAGTGVASLLVNALVEAGVPEAEAVRKFYLLNSQGLLVEGANRIRDAQKRFVHPRSAVADWKLENPAHIGLLDVVRNTKATVLIGVSGQGGAFTEEVVREVGKHSERPIILPLSNPTDKTEALPVDIMKWTEGRALIGTGSPFPPLEQGGRMLPVAQTNNSYIFPGLGLGVIAVQARRVTDALFSTAAKALAAASPVHKDRNGPLLPPLSASREVSFQVAMAVARRAQQDGLAAITDPSVVEERVRAKIWTPQYLPYHRVRA